MQFTPYPHYKPCHIEWLGDVPEHWEVVPIKNIYNRIKRIGFEKETLLSVYRDYGVIIKDSRDDNHNRASEDLSPYQLVNIGDLVINKMKAWQGSLAISEYRGIVSPAYYVYKPNSEIRINSKFIHNQIRSEYFIQSYKNYSKGVRVGQWDLEDKEFTRLNLYLPPLSEQTQIVKFLEKETALIDELIEKQQKLITLLKEHRKAIISHAVTKGLNPNSKMKKSGVEWSGDVPEHWEVVRFGRIFEKKEITNQPQEKLLSVYLDRGVIPYSEGGGLVHKPSENLEKYQLVDIGDFVMNNQQAWRGSVGISTYKGIVSPAYLVFSYNQNLYTPNYLKYLLRDKGIVEQFMISSLSVGTIQRQIKWYLLKQVNLPLPPISEQIQIVKFLEKETVRIDELIAKQTTLIEQLKTYRTAIIAYAVTGKIDVREMA